MNASAITFYLKRLYKNYVHKFLNKIFLALFLSMLVAGSTSAIAWLLDPAIKKIFIDNDRTYALFIPILIILAFSTKGISLYLADELVVGVLVFLVPLILPIPVMFLGLFTSAIQALIFATLAAYYIGEAVEEHH